MINPALLTVSRVISRDISPSRPMRPLKLWDISRLRGYFPLFSQEVVVVKIPRYLALFALKSCHISCMDVKSRGINRVPPYFSSAAFKSRSINRLSGCNSRISRAHCSRPLKSRCISRMDVKIPRYFLPPAIFPIWVLKSIDFSCLPGWNPAVFPPLDAGGR